MKIIKHATDDTSYFNSGKTCNLKFTSLTISISNPKDDTVKALHSKAVATELEKVSVHSNPKERQC